MCWTEVKNSSVITYFLIGQNSGPGDHTFKIKYPNISIPIITIVSALHLSEVCIFIELGNVKLKLSDWQLQRSLWIPSYVSFSRWNPPASCIYFFCNYFHSYSDFRTVSSSQRTRSSWRLMESMLYECANTSPPCQALSAPQWHAGRSKRLGVEAHPALMDEVRPSSIVHTRTFVNLKAFVIIIPGAHVWWWPTRHASHIKM